jgi:PQQ-like domain
MQTSGSDSVPMNVPVQGKRSRAIEVLKTAAGVLRLSVPALGVDAPTFRSNAGYVKVQAKGPILSSLVVVDDGVCVGRVDGNLYALD